MSAGQSARALARIAACAADSKKGQRITAIDVSENLAITDIFLLIAADNERKVDAIVDEVQRQLILQADARPIRREGDRGHRWVLLDYIDLVIHIQHDEERDLYALDKLWKDCPEIALELESG